MKYAYPAIFTPEDSGYSISFPDIRMGGTQGDSIPDGLEMAHDFLIGAMIMMEDEMQEMPTPSEIHSLPLNNGEFASFIFVDTEKYRRNQSMQTA